MIRNRALLDLTYQIPCQIRLPGCDGGPGEPAHSNQQRHGKGTGLKAHDCFFASSCRSCHHQLDNGAKLTREERADAWQRGFERTLVELWERRLIQVSTSTRSR